MKPITLALSVLAAVGVLAAPAASAGQELVYSAGDTLLKGYIARPPGPGKHPGVLVVHEWWGNNDYSHHRADMLADAGYVALAVDMYGNGEVADTAKGAARLSGWVHKHMDVAEQRFRAALAILDRQPDVDPARVGAIGFCFGGFVVLDMARRGLPLEAVASFHGTLGGLSPIAPGGVKAKVLVLNGGADRFVKPDQIAAFKQSMTAAGADFRFISYPGAVHAFTNPAATTNGLKFGLPLAYDPEAAWESWQEMEKMFASTLR